MNTTKTTRGLGRRFLDFIDSFDYTSSDFLEEQARQTAARVSDLEQRIANLEQTQAILREAGYKKVV